MSRGKKIELNKQQVYDVKRLAAETRQMFGVYPNIPIGSDIRLLLGKKGILLCEYPYPDTEGTHTYGTITWMQTDRDTLTFIGLNTSSYYDEQIFAIAHEIYHYTTRTGKAYTPDKEEEDMLTEKQADRFAAELLLPEDALKAVIRDTFDSSDMYAVPENQVIRLIARLQCDWWLPYQAIVIRLYEENMIEYGQYKKLYGRECRAQDSLYQRILKNTDREIAELLNKKTRTIGISNSVTETIIRNYEDGFIEEDEFVETLELFGKKPEDFGFEIKTEPDAELTALFESEGDA